MAILQSNFALSQALNVLETIKRKMVKLLHSGLRLAARLLYYNHGMTVWGFAAAVKECYWTKKESDLLMVIREKGTTRGLIIWVTAQEN